jgi:hypothetical protein
MIGTYHTYFVIERNHPLHGTEIIDGGRMTMMRRRYQPGQSKLTARSALAETGNGGVVYLGHELEHTDEDTTAYMKTRTAVHHELDEISLRAFDATRLPPPTRIVFPFCTTWENKTLQEMVVESIFGMVGACHF